jgi:DNA-binding transcriptional LysR family regulator
VTDQSPTDRVKDFVPGRVTHPFGSGELNQGQRDGLTRHRRVAAPEQFQRRLIHSAVVRRDLGEVIVRVRPIRSGHQDQQRTMGGFSHGKGAGKLSSGQEPIIPSPCAGNDLLPWEPSPEMMPDLDSKLLPDLLVFFEVARVGSISEAARRLHMVQTNVTVRVQKLEDALGARLLDRGARGSRLTAAGEALVPLAARLAALLDDIDLAFQKSDNRNSALLRLGAIETVVATRLPSLLEGCRAKHRWLQFTITSGSSISLIKMLQEGLLDAAFVSYPARSDCLRTEIEFRDELVLLTPPETVAPQAADVVALVDRFPLLIQRLGCSYTERFISYLSRGGSRPPRLIEAGTLEGVLGFVEQGLGIAVVPRTFVDHFARRVRVVSLDEFWEERHVSVHLVSASERSASQGLELFLRHCRIVLGPAQSTLRVPRPRGDFRHRVLKH